MKLSKWCKKQGVCYGTGLNWFHGGLIPSATQLPTGTIMVDDNEVAINHNKENKDNVFVYCRVSNNSRREEMNYQVDRCIAFCNAKGIAVSKVYKEIASGMNDKRRELWRMLDNNPSTIIIEHKDRLTRFGFEYIEKLLAKQNCKVIIMNQDKVDETDLMKDLVSIITSFCCRLYGLRRGAKKTKKIKEELNKEETKDLNDE